MIPSDHFVRFYNEVFKKIDELDGLKDYYVEISHNQAFFCLEDFQKKGLQGVYDYYIKIRKEENCDMDIEFDGPHCLILRMNVCPSLSKAIDNDAGACEKYCDHCPGWVLPVYKKANLYNVFNLMGRDTPKCIEYIYDNQNDAEEKYIELLKSSPTNEIYKSW